MTLKMFVNSLLMLMKHYNKVIVFGGNHHNTLGVIRSLGMKGISSTLLLVDSVENRISYISKSRYIEKTIKTSTYEQGGNYLIDSATNVKEKIVLICCSDGASSIVDKNYDVLSQHYYLPNCAKQGEINRLMSKEVISQLARDVGLHVPRTWISINETIPENLKYPCIIKPLYSIDGSKDDIFVCFSQNDLLNYFHEGHCRNLQIQTFIFKKFEYQFIGCSIDGGRQVIIPGVAKIIRPSERSNTGFLYYDKLDRTFENAMEKTKRILKNVKYSGLFSAEFLRDNDGNDFFMEINFRNDGNAIAVTAAGINLPYIWYCSANNSQTDIASVNDVKPLYVMPEFDDLIHVFQRQIRFGKWIKDMKRSDCYMEFDKDDIMPFVYRVLDFLSLLIKKIISRCSIK